MGLFIGASILTILELFDYLYEVRLLQEGDYMGVGVGGILLNGIIYFIQSGSCH